MDPFFPISLKLHIMYAHFQPKISSNTSNFIRCFREKQNAAYRFPRRLYIVTGDLENIAYINTTLTFYLFLYILSRSMISSFHNATIDDYYFCYDNRTIPDIKNSLFLHLYAQSRYPKTFYVPTSMIDVGT